MGRLTELKGKQLVKEKGGLRGLVPSSTFGRFDEPYNNFLAHIDPRVNSDAEFSLAASPDQRFREFALRMNEPRYKRWSYAALAKSCDISLAEFADWWRKAQFARATAIAQEAVVVLTRDLAKDVRTKDLVCERCDGFGWVRAEKLPAELARVAAIKTVGDVTKRTCPACKGLGTVEKPGDEASRKLLLEMAGMTGKRSAVVQINQNFGQSYESAVERLNKITFTVDGDGVTEVPAEVPVEPPEPAE